MESKFAKEIVIIFRLQIMFSCLAIVSVPLFYGGYIAIWAPITLFFSDLLLRTTNNENKKRLILKRGWTEVFNSEK